MGSDPAFSNGVVRLLADGSYLPMVRGDGGYVDPPPGEPSKEDAHEAADRTRELSGVSESERRRSYWASPVVVER